MCAAVTRIRLVPDANRRFVQREAHLERLHGIQPTLLTQLLDCGLPHRNVGGSRRYDTMDLENVGLALRLGPRWRAMRWWSDSLANVDPDTDVDYRISVTATCPEPGHDGECRFRLAPQLVRAAAPGAVREETPGGYTFDIHIPSGRHDFGGPFAPLVDAATALRFHLLPNSLADDLGFLRATGLADCRLASRHLVEFGAELGLRVRTVQGMFLAVPYSVWHTWIELHTGDGWFAADPFLLGAFRDWGVIDSERWPPGRSPHAMLWPLEETHFVKVTHAGKPASSRFGVAMVREAATAREPAR